MRQRDEDEAYRIALELERLASELVARGESRVLRGSLQRTSLAAVLQLAEAKTRSSAEEKSRWLTLARASVARCLGHIEAAEARGLGSPERAGACRRLAHELLGALAGRSGDRGEAPEDAGATNTTTTLGTAGQARRESGRPAPGASRRAPEG